MIKLILLRGLPGSGKSTLGALLCDVVVSADDYFTNGTGQYNFDPTKIKAAHLWCIEATRSWIKSIDACPDNDYSDRIIGIANTFTQEWEMQPYFELAQEYNIQVHTVIVENRHGGRNVHGVPDDAVKRMRDRFEVVL